MASQRLVENLFNRDSTITITLSGYEWCLIASALEDSGEQILLTEDEREARGETIDKRISSTFFDLSNFIAREIGFDK